MRVLSCGGGDVACLIAGLLYALPFIDGAVVRDRLDIINGNIDNALTVVIGPCVRPGTTQTAIPNNPNIYTRPPMMASAE